MASEVKGEATPPKEASLAPLAPTRSRMKNNATNSNAKWTDEEDALLKKLANKPDPQWAEIAKQFPNKTRHQVTDRWEKVLNPNLLKGSWTGEEDTMIIQWVKENGAKNWGSLSELLPGRISKQCRERWHNHLCPSITKSDWTKEEDDILIEHQKLWGNKWSKIAALLPGRTDNSVKNRWNSSLKRRLERIASGQQVLLKRGRKPKRPSEAPTGEIPKPNIEEITLKASDTLMSPMLLDSPGALLNTPGKWLNCMTPNLMSPGIPWQSTPSPNFIAKDIAFNLDSTDQIPQLKLDNNDQPPV